MRVGVFRTYGDLRAHIVIDDVTALIETRDGCDIVTKTDKFHLISTFDEVLPVVLPEPEKEK